MSDLKPFAFVLMPFSTEFDDVYKVGIQEVAKKLNIVAERVDEQTFSETILERIYRQIEYADFIIADMSGRNPNVFYEVGYAHAKNKPVILLTKDVHDIPFDLKHHRHLVYNGSLSQLRKLLRAELIWQKSELEIRRTKPISISVKTSPGILLDNSWKADANFDFTIDLKNSSGKRSPEIEAIYIHSGDGWKLTQENILCASTESNISPFTRRHFIKTPVPRLSPEAWAQIKISNTKTVWRGYEGSEKKDSYSVKGSALIEIVTSEGSFKETVNIDVTVDEIPF